MKKSNFKNLNLDSSEKLNRNELKNLVGGSLVASCTADCGDGTSVTCDGGGCVAMDSHPADPNHQGWCSAITQSGVVDKKCKNKPPEITQM